MSCKISVIVPFYNTEIYIRDCIRSVLKQSFMDFELILIDDGSSDRSVEICEKMCERDNRIRMIRQEHRGVSAARNAGMRAAEGKYVFFMDSDDIIHPQLLEALYCLQEKNQTGIATVSLFCAAEGKFQKPEEWKIEKIGKQESTYLSNSDALKLTFFANPEIMLYAIGGKLILRQAVGSLRFDNALTHGEDTWFVYQLLMRGADVSVLRRNWYYYRKFEKSDDEVYSIAACRSRYKAKRNMLCSQIKCGRLENALAIEWDILLTIVEWYEKGRRRNDRRFVKYIGNLARVEEKSWIFSRLKWYRRVLFRVGCEHYPFFHRFHKWFKV